MRALAQGAEPEWIDPKRLVGELYEVGSGGEWEGQILNEELLGVTAGVESRVHHASVEEFVEVPASESVEGCEEILEGGMPNPESPSVISKQVFV